MPRASRFHNTELSGLRDSALLERRLRALGEQEREVKTELANSPPDTGLLNARNALRETIKQVTRAYNDAVCREICSKMHAMLPRELRDMVYKFMLQDHRIIVHDRYTGTYAALDRQRRDWGPPPDDYLTPSHPYFSEAPRTPRDELCPETFWQVEPAVAADFMYAWYRECEFVISFDHDVVDPAFLRIDRFGMGFDPKALITRVTKDVAVRGAKILEIAAVTDSFKCLAGLGPQAQVHIRFLMNRRYGGLIDATLESLNSVVLQLLRVGPQVRASFGFRGQGQRLDAGSYDRHVADWIRIAREVEEESMIYWMKLQQRWLHAAGC